MSNHLANETSPYLLQHVDNPVDWYPWGPAALEKSQKEEKPIFLSIGYASCHWCHVMAHESFEDPAIAALLNDNFVSIKVDREQRPDLDSIYMNFVVATLGSGGWPMSIFLTPECKPFYGGTYFPPNRQHNLPAFREVLMTVARLWKTDREAILSSSENLTHSLQPHLAAQPSGAPLSPELLSQVILSLSHGYDWQDGGWGGAPKFPQPMLIEFLLRQASCGDTTSLNMALHALRSMARGGMYDVLGGGFARYSVDSSWLIPHFEKMLYDNALLAGAYLHAYQLTGEAFFRQVCTATLDFILRELTQADGAFFSSLDADSEGVEGKFYIWTPGEIVSSLSNPPDAELFLAAYDINQAGNFDGHTILRQKLTDEILADRFETNVASVSSRLDASRRRLLEVRNLRVKPSSDDKVLVAWNALALAVFADAGRALDQPVYLDAAIRNANFLLDKLLFNGRLMRSWRRGVANHPAYLQDYAGLVVALLTLYQCDPNLRWYQTAIQLLEMILAHFTDPAGGFFDTTDDHEPLLYRPKDIQDNATPSGNAMVLAALLQLSAYEGRSDWRQLAEVMLTDHQGLFLLYPSAFAQWLCAADFALGPAHQVAILGAPSDPDTQILLKAVWHRYHQRLVLAASSYPIPSGSPVLLTNRTLLNGKPTAYVCQDFLCRLPVNDPETMLAQLSM